MLATAIPDVDLLAVRLLTIREAVLLDTLLVPIHRRTSRRGGLQSLSRANTLFFQAEASSQKWKIFLFSLLNEKIYSIQRDEVSEMWDFY